MSTTSVPPQPRLRDPEGKKFSDNELEDIFLTNALDNYRFFKAQSERLRTGGKDPAMCDQYAEAHCLLLNRFTYIEPQETEEEI